MDAKSCEKVAKNYGCEVCDYVTSRKSSMNKHLLTSKHINRTKLTIFEHPSCNKQNFKCKKCAKLYKVRNSLWYHEQKCVLKETSETILEKNENVTISNIVMELIKSNTELQKQMMEVCKKGNNTVIKNNNNNSHNKTFNLQFFLNEQCKDAMNLTEFIDTMTLEFSDLEDVGKLGYVEGISKIMIRKLNELDIYKRPIHCSDSKREIMYVKEHNVWEKEKNSNEHIRKAIKRVTHKNGGLLVPWSLENPNCMNLDHHLNDIYLRMMGQSMGGSGEFVDNENKIMKKIAKAVFIDKM
jgi:hypothetical protein